MRILFCFKQFLEEKVFLRDQGRVSLSEEESIDTMQIAILYAAFLCQYAPAGVSP